MKSEIILLTNHYDKAPLEIIKQAVPEGFELISPDSLDRKELMEKIVQADYLLVSGRQKIDRELLECAEKLKMIQRTGVGTDMIDLDYVRTAGIPVYINRGVNAHSVAEHTLLLMLASLRRLIIIDKEVKSGLFIKQSNGVRTNELRGKTVGLAGMGRIGREVAALLAPFGCKIFYYDKFRLSDEEEKKIGVTFVSVDELFEKSRILSLHCPLTDETRQFVNEKRLSLMRNDAVLVNTARGGLIDQDALYYALKDHRIGCAALDVYTNEPVDPDEKILKLDNVITTPHIGGVTKESFYDMMNMAMENIKCFSRGLYDEIKDKELTN